VLETVRAAEEQRVAFAEAASRSVVCIFGDRSLEGGGSGVVIDPDGYGLTNFHVVQEFYESRQGYGGLSDGKLYRLRVIGLDPGGDVALFKLEGREAFPAAPLGDSGQLRVGQAVGAIGNPFVLAEDFSPTFTYGMISGLHRYQEGQGNLLEYADCIQVSTSINPGNSGGPLFDLQGRVIGINGRASFEERGRVNVGLGYAISINQIKRFLPGLYAGRLMEHGTVGVQVREIGERVVINAIQDFSPAEKAGLALGDAILQIDGRLVRTANDFTNFTALYPADWPVRVTAEREGRTFDALARLERLSLGQPIVYTVDAEHNHQRLQRLFTGRSGPAGGERAAAPETWRITVDGDDSNPAASVEARFTPGIDPPIPTSDESDSPAALAAEFAVLAAPLCRVPVWTLDWTLLGGDEVGGRVVAVARRSGPPPASADQARPEARWLMDWETGALVQATIGDSDRPDAVVWRPLDPYTPGVERLPTRWERIRGDAVEQILVRPDDAATNAASAPAAEGAP
jgi:S1-C subfamily serine protease